MYENKVSDEGSRCHRLAAGMCWDDGTAQEAAVESHNSGPGDLGVGSLVDSQYVKYTE